MITLGRHILCKICMQGEERVDNLLCCAVGLVWLSDWYFNKMQDYKYKNKEWTEVARILKTDRQWDKNSYDRFEICCCDNRGILHFVLCNFVVTEGRIWVPFLLAFSQEFEHLMNSETGFAFSKHSSNLHEVCTEDEERVDHILCSPLGLLWLQGWQIKLIIDLC